MKRTVLRIISFIIVLLVTTELVFEITFRFSSGDFVISVLERFAAVGIQISFDSFFVILVVSSVL